MPMESNRVREHDTAIRSDIDDEVKEDQEQERRKCKKKRSESDSPLIRPLPMELTLCIRGAEGIDDEVELAEARPRWYCVVYWIEPDKVYHTRAVQAVWNNPGWDELDFIPVLDYIPGNYGFLNVEVARLCSDTDPGPSTGSVIVGRVRVPLPRVPYRTIEDRFKLVRHIGDGHMCLAGDIILCMKLRVLPNYQPPDYYIINDQ